MSWEEILKEREAHNEKYGESERVWMERDIETAYNVESHKQSEVNKLLEYMVEELDNRMHNYYNNSEYITYKDINEREVKKKLLPIIKEIVENHLEFDMNKFTYTGP